MFITKKALLGKLDFANTRLGLIENYNSYLNKRVDEYRLENSKLKRDLEIESRQKEELAELLAEAERDAHCPEDCKNRKNPNACRTCTRYPNAKDKYEVVS